LAIPKNSLIKIHYLEKADFVFGYCKFKNKT